jgi:integrase
MRSRVRISWPRSVRTGWNDPETSRRVLQRIKIIFDWCKAQGYCTGDNPTQGLTKVLPKHRTAKGHHAALPFKEVGGFVHALRQADAGESVKLAFEFTILTAARTSETLGAQWSEFDLEAKTWTIPRSRMKANVEHRVPLAPRCVQILKRAKAIGLASTCFQGETGRSRCRTWRS